MTNSFLLFVLCCSLTASAQTFAPSYGQPGSTAIPKDSSCFTGWATHGTVHRGFVNINDTTFTYNGNNRATNGIIDFALGVAQGDIVNVLSLGDSGYVTLTFDQLIVDGPGFDFAVFENSFDDNYMELAHVEVSSDGIHFIRFPSTSETPTNQQLGNASYSDCRYIDNLAGKYKRGFGVPFDLSDLPNDPFLNTSAITHVRVVDAIGAVTGIGTQDQNGTVINDPYPTPFASGGFDLDAIGIMNGVLSVSEQEELAVTIGPNPTCDQVFIAMEGTANVSVYTISGQLIQAYEHAFNGHFSFSELHLESGSYLIQISSEAGISVKRIVYNP